MVAINAIGLVKINNGGIINVINPAPVHIPAMAIPLPVVIF